jgi:ATP-dependent DNA helicase RecG
MPTHEVAFQVLHGTQVRVNDFYRTPLLKTFERVMEQFKARVEEDEILVEGFRVPIPNYDGHAVRETIVNAFTHRDYTHLGTVHIRMESHELVVSNPGGFVEGVTAKNLLIVDPKPRNPLLADIFKRIGLAERTGRGVDLIYESVLRYGRPEPDYSRSDRVTVVVRLKSPPADISFFQMILKEEKRRGSHFSVDALIVLARLRKESPLALPALASAIQKPETDTKAMVQNLIESGLIEAHESAQGRSYSLKINDYHISDEHIPYIRETSARIFPAQQKDTGRKEAIEEGKLQERRSVARNMLVLGVDIDTICAATQLDRQEIEKLRDK